MIYFLKPSREQVASIRTNLIMRSIAPFIKVLTYRYLRLVNLEYGDIALKKDNKTGKYQREAR